MAFLDSVLIAAGAIVLWTLLLLVALCWTWYLLAPRGGVVRPAHLALLLGVFPVAFGLMVGQPGALVAAVVALEDGAEFDEAAVRERLTGELSAYKIPKRFATVPRSDIPLLSSGKVDLPALQKMFDA